jgi:hypothetical protein
VRPDYGLDMCQGVRGSSRVFEQLAEKENGKKCSALAWHTGLALYISSFELWFRTQTSKAQLVGQELSVERKANENILGSWLYCENVQTIELLESGVREEEVGGQPPLVNEYLPCTKLFPPLNREGWMERRNKPCVKKSRKEERNNILYHMLSSFGLV